MRFPSHPKLLVLAAAFAVAAQAVPAAAGSFYKWETENGGIAFTDGPKQIPARYREQAEEFAVQKLGDFERFTPMAASQPAGYAARLDGRLGHLRDLNQRTVSPDAVTAPQAAPTTALRAGAEGQDIEAQLGMREGDEPVIVETVRSRPPGSPVTRHITIVRQGDEILSVIKPEQLHSKPSALDERELHE
jgi:hypothetical protein